MEFILFLNVIELVAVFWAVPFLAAVFLGIYGKRRSGLEPKRIDWAGWTVIVYLAIFWPVAIFAFFLPFLLKERRFWKRR